MTHSRIRSLLRRSMLIAAVLALPGCVAYGPGYGYAPGYPAPAYGYYAAPPVGIVVGGGGYGWHHWR